MSSATLTVNGSQFVFELELTDGTKATERGIAVLNESAKPKRFDWNGTGPKGGKFQRTGSYELTAAEFKLVNDVRWPFAAAG